MPLLLLLLLLHQPQWLASQLSLRNLQQCMWALLLLLLPKQLPAQQQQQQQRHRQRSLAALSHQSKAAATRSLTCHQHPHLTHMQRQPLLPLHTLLPLRWSQSRPSWQRQQRS
jgi:hypothetical protein